MRKPWFAVCVAVVAVLIATGCDWAQDLYGPEHTGSSPDTSVSAAAIEAGTIGPSWTAPLGTMGFVVAGGRAYVGGPVGTIVGYDAKGTAGCSGVPKTCTTQWIGDPGNAESLAFPAYADGTVLASSVFGTLYAFDATGATNCSGNPPVCSPIWTAPGLGLGLTGTIAGGTVYRSFTPSTGVTGLAAYDLAGVQNCTGSPKVCQPLWTASVSGTEYATPAVSNGIAYLSSSSGLYAFDAAGSLGCAGAPKVCTARWHGAVPGATTFGAITVANGLVFVAASAPRALVGYDAAGIRGCAGSPKTCQPVWSAPKAGPGLSVAKNKVYASANGGLSVYDATGSTSCSAAGVCHPLWRYPDDNCASNPFPCSQFGPPSVVNGVVYRGSSSSTAGVLTAYDANGSINCNAAKVCSPLHAWSGSNSTSTAIAASGSVYSAAQDGRLVVLGPP